MPRLTLSMIVKDEEKYLHDCLESVKNVVDEIVIVDTGSTDKTVEIAKFFGAQVYSFEWVNDFSAARNYALSKTTGDWILYLDADERLDPKSVEELKRLTSSKQKAAYYCTVVSLDREDSRDNSIRYPRLFPNHEGLFFTGKVHEQIEPSLIQYRISIAQSKIVIHHYGYSVSKEEKQQKAKRNLLLLKQEFESNNSPYTAFQLALTYNVLKDIENAVKFFKLASEANGLERQYRAYCFSSLALIAHQNQKTADSEKYIYHAIKIDDKQPFTYLLASKIALRKGEGTIAEEKCRRAYSLNQDLIAKGSTHVLSVLLDPEELIYFGLILSLQNRTIPNYQYYQKELYNYYKNSEGNSNSFRLNVINKIFTNSSFTREEAELLIKITNNNNISFFIFMLANNPYKQQVISIVANLIQKYPDNVEVNKSYAKLLDEFGKSGEAIALLEKVVGKNVNDPAVYFYLISFYLKLGEDEKIKPLVIELEKKFSNIPEVMTRVRTLKRKLLMLTSVPL